MEGVATEAQQTVRHMVAPFCSILHLIFYLSRNKMDYIHLLQVHSWKLYVRHSHTIADYDLDPHKLIV